MIITVIMSYTNVTMKTNGIYSLNELGALTETPLRTIRYYIQQGLVDRPDGSTRSARYAQRHIEQLLEIRKWQKAGLSLERIRDLLVAPEGDGQPVPPTPKRPGDVSVRSHISIHPGVELVVDPGEAQMTPEEVRDLARKVIGLLARNEENEQ